MAEITMYGAEWCSDCRRAKRVFARLNVAYEYVDLVAEPERVDEARRLGRAKRIPVIVLGDERVLVEPSDQELESALERSGASSAPSAT